MDSSRLGALINDCAASGFCRDRGGLTRAVRLPPLRWLATAKLEWEPRDLWIGVYWTRGAVIENHQAYSLWLTIVPGAPLHVWWYRRIASDA